MKYVLVLSFFLVQLGAIAQNESLIIVPKNRIELDTLGNGTVTFIASDALTSLELNERGKNNIQGYRIQIFFGPLDAAKKARQEFISAYPGMGAYLEQNIPDFSVRVGDFPSEMEAKGAWIDLKRIYPNSYIVKGRIEPPNLNLYKPAKEEY